MIADSATKKDTLIFLDGAFIPEEKAHISMLDRGFLFADGIYDVIPTIRGKMLAAPAHIERLMKNLSIVGIDSPYTEATWLSIAEQLLQSQTTKQDILIYIQVTRGTQEMRQATWDTKLTPTIMVMGTPYLPCLHQKQLNSKKAMLHDDIRWQWCHIKSTQLMANAIIAQKAKKGGMMEAILVKEGHVTEGTSSNVFFVKDKTLITPKADQRILPGITRKLVLSIAKQLNLAVEERNCQPKELLMADELFITSSSKGIQPIDALDNTPIGDGQIGPITEQLFDTYLNTVINPMNHNEC